MQIILLEKVTNLGNLGDVVKVKDGYARNYLIPQKKARRATPVALEEFAQRRAELEKIQAEKLAAAQTVAEKMNGVALTITRKSAMDGRLFGSVTNHDIAHALKENGFTVDKGHIRMPNGPLKTTGEFPLEISLHTDVLATINVTVSGE
ncbi:MAG: 50S ribosomal protein L9 [Zoogloeaceae bacterium]|jgi:large subunit ribosomal protein L9|nr:50S ribosomal protein L9 [Zoogloeaceae bacterium]